VVEDECLVAAGALVPPRMRVPARSFVVGRPAKVLRALRDDELAQIREASAHYVQNATIFRSQLELL
jgi:carbonic anhydrase/acetyltransferase-like protein (isoleucine patch superfamily)